MNKHTQSPIQSPVLWLIFVALIWAFANPARAELEYTGSYAGLQFTDLESRFDADAGGRGKDNRGRWNAKYGWMMNDILSLELHLGITTNSKTNRGVLTYGAYGKFGKDFDQYKLYGLVGMGGYSAYDDDADDESETSASLGGGIEIFGSKDLAITLEVVRVLDKSVDDGDLTFDSIGLGVTYYFTRDTSYFNKNRNKIKSIRY